jgi:hypothetical protein
MRTLLQLIDLITSDTITLAVSGVLVLAVLALLVLIAWPSRPASSGTPRSPSRAQSRTPSSGHARTPSRTPSRTPASTRSAEARVLFAAGTPAAEVARRTGLSRDALALLGGMASASARQKAPASARLSVWQRFRRAMGMAPVTRQATV